MSCNISIGLYVDDVLVDVPCPKCERDGFIEYDICFSEEYICTSCKREDKINQILK